jgi:hypothetical protein
MNAGWLGWGEVIEVGLAPFERREQNAFARNLPPGVGTPDSNKRWADVTPSVRPATHNCC